MKSILSGWGRQSVCLVDEEIPKDAGTFSSFLAKPYLPRGQGRSYGDAALPAQGHCSVNTSGIDRLLSFNPATGVLDAEAGATLTALLAVSIPRGYFLPVTPGTMCVSLGGALASNVHGKNHHRVGSIEKFVLEMEVNTPIGTFVCTPEKHRDLFVATLGGYGLTGCITRVKLQMIPIITSDVHVLRVKAPDLDGLFRLFAEHDGNYEYSVAWLDTLAKGKSLGRGVLMLGNHARVKFDDADSGPVQSPLAYPQKRKLRVPFAMPAVILNRPLLGAFNQLFYAVAPNHGLETRENFEGFFYPLDRIRDWNLLYGKSGFFQYQCVIPDPRGEEGIAACLRFLSDNGLGAFLSVLKRCGNDEVMIPFCKHGYTLALDIPFRGPVTLKLLDKLDELVIGFQGRVYLSKDARLSPESFRAMYPEFGAWMDVVRRYNPNAKSDSRLAERLGLWKG